MTWQDIKKLKQQSGFPSISILVPTHKTMPERLQDPIIIKDLIKEATDRLLKEFDKNSVMPIIRSLDNLANSIDFTKVKNGLAFFVNSNFSRLFDLTFDVSPKVVIDKKFALKDIIRALIKNPKYWILSLSHEPAKLYISANNHLDEVIDSVELQQNMQGFPYHWNYEVTSDREQLAYGTGDRDCGYMTELDKKFLNELDKVFDKHFSSNPLPIIILGTEKNRAYFEQVTKHKKWIIAQHEGDFTKTGINEISKLAQTIMDAYVLKQSENELQILNDAVGKLKHTIGVNDVWHKALEGRIHLLLVEDDLVIPGAINPEFPDQIIFFDNLSLPGSSDIVDHIIEQVIETDGKVVFVKSGTLKEYEKIAGILRY